MARWLEAEGFGDGVVRFAYEQTGCAARVRLTLRCEDGETAESAFSCRGSVPGVQLAVVAGDSPGLYTVTITVPPSDVLDRDDEVRITVRSEAEHVPECQVVLRRTTCPISTALLESQPGNLGLRDQCAAALRWYAWNRYTELVGLRRFTSGKSGSDVIVFRPRLREPQGPCPPGSLLPGVVSQAWGSALLVKTGVDRKVREEWERFRVFLADRLHPFMSRSEEFLTVLPAETDEVLEAGADPQQKPARPGPVPDGRDVRKPLKLHIAAESSRIPENSGGGDQDAALTNAPNSREFGYAQLQSRESDQATMIGSFLGGELVRAEAFDQFFQSGNDPGQCVRALDQLFQVLAPWYQTSIEQPLGRWHKVFRQTPDDRLSLFGKFDLTDPTERQRYAGALAWDIDWLRHEHLQDQLLGRGQNRDGLLYRLRDWPVRYSLTHGDLHPRNVLYDGDNVWLLDFGEVGVAPTLFDFAKLELYVRLWCLQPDPSGRCFDEAAQGFETLLLDHVTGSEASLEPVRGLAEELGIAEGELLKAAHVICAIRRASLRYGLGHPDRRDYLAVLYLTVLDSLRFAGRESERTWNYRLVLGFAWILEDVLSRIAGLTPFRRARVPLDARCLITKDWLADPGTPGRVLYLMNSPDGARALAPLAATRGVLQNDHHHLDVFDHTLLVLAYVERLMEDPVGGLLDPFSLDAAVHEDLRRQGIFQPAVGDEASGAASPDISAVEPLLDDLRAVFAERLTPAVKLCLKWAALLHDLGKPATRVLNVDRLGAAKIQFLGHERYGLELIRGHVATWFAPACPAGDGRMAQDERGWVCPQCKRRAPRIETDEAVRIERLVRYHHLHHHLVDRYLAEPGDGDGASRQPADRLAAIRRAVTADTLSDGEYKELSKIFDPEFSDSAADFPLLMLHGFADKLACRGPAKGIGPVPTAEFNLLILVAYVRYPRLKQIYLQQQAMDGACRELTSGFDQPLGITGPDLGTITRHTRDWCEQELARRRAADQPGPDRAEALAEARRYARQHGIDVNQIDPPGDP